MQINTELQKMGSIPQERSQLKLNKAMFCFLDLAHTLNKCPFHGFFRATFFSHIFVLSVGVLPFRMALLCSAGVLSHVPEHERPQCALRRIDVC